jgi:carbon storage regulator
MGMLCLSRKKGEKVIIGDGLGTITILDIIDEKVRLGFDFPRDIAIHREEIQKLINEKAKDSENDESSVTQTGT